MNDSSDLIAAIEEQFRDAPRPANDAIAMYYTEIESEEKYVREYFSDKTWQEISVASLWDEYPGPPDACLYFMSSAGYRYFLPSFMIISLRDYDEADTLPGATVFLLSPSIGGDIDGWTESNRGFTEAQRAVIIQFLEFMEATHDECGLYPDQDRKRWRQLGS